MVTSALESRTSQALKSTSLPSSCDHIIVPKKPPILTALKLLAAFALHGFHTAMQLLEMSRAAHGQGSRHNMQVGCLPFLMPVHHTKSCVVICSAPLVPNH